MGRLPLSSVWVTSLVAAFIFPIAISLSMDLASLPLYSSYDRLMVTFSELRTYVGVNLEIYQSGTEVLKKWDICSNNWDKSFLLVILSNTQPTRSPCCLKIACSLGFLWGDWFSLSIRRAGNVDGLNFARGIHYLYTNACRKPCVVSPLKQL